MTKDYVLCIDCGEITYPEAYNTVDEDVKSRICNGCGLSFTVKDMWSVLGDTPVNDDGEIEIPYLHFCAWTDREDIWHWFEYVFDISIVDYFQSKGDTNE